jgi:uncharacterized membrane protein YhaH (DUF805 family)
MNAPEFFKATIDPYRRLLDFSGRSTRGQFWPFLFLMYAASQIGTYTALSPLLVTLQNFAALPPEQLEAAQMPDLDVEGTFRRMMIYLVAGFAFFALPLIGVTIRRLHDINRRGWWGLPAGVLLCWSGYNIWHLFARFAQSGAVETNQFLIVFGSNLAYLIAVITLLILCGRDGTVGPNRFGADPKNRDPDSVAVKQTAAPMAGQAPRADANAPFVEPPKGPARIIR